MCPSLALRFPFKTAQSFRVELLKIVPKTDGCMYTPRDNISRQGDIVHAVYLFIRETWL